MAASTFASTTMTAPAPAPNTANTAAIAKTVRPRPRVPANRVQKPGARVVSLSSERPVLAV
eukprot:1036722-Pleurochrysis_carterae.AAC.1